MYDIPQTTTEITPEWLTAALRKGGVLRDGGVAACRVTPIGQESGFASRLARVEIDYDRPQSKVPAALVVKLGTSSRDELRSATLREKNIREARFYQQVAPHAGIRVPRCYYSACEADGTGFVLLLEDLSHGRFGDVAAGWRVADAERAIDRLADLHAAWWESPRLARYEWLPTYATNSAEQLGRLVERRKEFLRRYGTIAAGEAQDLTRRLGPQHEPLLNRLQGPPETLLHVDAHLDNVVFVPAEDGDEAVFFDWQGVRRGLCVVDLALFVNCTAPDQRRDHETRLLERYHARLAARGIEGYPIESCLEDYRIALLRWWIGTVNGLGSDYAASWTGRQADLARQGVERWSTAVTDHRLTALA
ncbi:MAG: ecdysteroid 22-kinase family protein [Planctomycetes bacterium]|nr:ecdysteroid 22-kinase family protein [Planctomycetota bacterium]